MNTEQEFEQLLGNPYPAGMKQDATSIKRFYFMAGRKSGLEEAAEMADYYAGIGNTLQQLRAQSIATEIRQLAQEAAE